MTLKGAMAHATLQILDEFKLKGAWEINDEHCFDWALKVFNLMPGTAIGGHRIDGEGQSYIIYEGKCYDAETPDGVYHWTALTAFQRMLGLALNNSL